MFDQQGNKKEEIQDPKTGQTIIREVLPPMLCDPIRNAIAQHAAASNEFMGVSRNFIKFIKRAVELDNIIDREDQAVKKHIKEAVISLKFDPKEEWGYNMDLQCLERRVAPVVGPLQPEKTNG